MYRVSKTFRFSASHTLPWHDGKCRNLHGHNYKVQLIIAAPTINYDPEDPKYGMLLDFAEMSSAMRPLLDGLDHTHLNDALVKLGIKPTALTYPTAEHLARAIAERVRVGLRDHYGTLGVMGWMLTVRVHETDDSYAEFEENV